MATLDESPGSTRCVRSPRWVGIALSVLAMCGCEALPPGFASRGQLTAPAPRLDALGPLRVSRANPRYFVDGTGQEILLAGSHTWGTLSDEGPGNPPRPLNFDAWLDYLQRHGHNFFRLWVSEQARWALAVPSDDIRARPLAYLRTGPGTALDGLPKFDLTRFDPAYFERLRNRVAAAARRGIYVSVMLFNGWSVANAKGSFAQRNPWLGHPFHPANNVNGIDGDPDRDGSGEETHTLALPAITALQEAYLRKVIDTVNEFDNVLYEVSNESGASSLAWQAHMMRVVRAYEERQRKQHPVGMTAIFPDGRNEDLFDSAADWISPNGTIDQRTPSDGRKVVLADTDHLCGVCGNRTWVWKSFTSGENPIFMDPYRHRPPRGIELPWRLDDPEFEAVRANLGHARALSARVDLASLRPRPERASSRYCLAAVTSQRAELVAYLHGARAVEIDLRDSPGTHEVEWLELSTGRLVSGPAFAGGRHVRLESPFRGDSVVRLLRVS